jgi:hypothetical protein
MLAACRPAGLSALGADYAGVRWGAMQTGAQRLARPEQGSTGPNTIPPRHRQQGACVPYRRRQAQNGLSSENRTRRKVAVQVLLAAIAGTSGPRENAAIAACTLTAGRYGTAPPPLRSRTPSARNTIPSATSAAYGRFLSLPPGASASSRGR